MAYWIISLLVSTLLIKGSYSQAVISEITNAICAVTPDPNLNSTIDPDLVSGSVTFSQEGDGDVTVTIQLSGFDTSDAGTLHGFHVHEKGDISGGCTSAGGHYNPEGVDHGLPEDSTRHVGDLGNIEEDENGDVSTTIVDSVISLTGDQSIIGRAIVVHADEDIGSAGDASGSAGTRLACCVIEEAPGDGAGSAFINRVLLMCSVLFVLLRLL